MLNAANNFMTPGNITYCVFTNFIELQLTNIQANYWWGQMHFCPPTKNWGGPLQRPLPMNSVQTVWKFSPQINILMI